MKKLISLGLGIVLALAAVQAFASAETPATPEAAAPAAPPPCTPAKQIYALGHWKQAHPARGKQICATPISTRRKLKSRYADYRLYRQVAPFPGPAGHGPRSPADGRWWAIPWHIVCGESHGNFYEANGDGAYQIIPDTWRRHGGLRFADIASHATPLQQHVVAHAAWAAGEPWYGDC